MLKSKLGRWSDSKRVNDGCSDGGDLDTTHMDVLRGRVSLTATGAPHLIVAWARRACVDVDRDNKARFPETISLLHSSPSI